MSRSNSITEQINADNIATNTTNIGNNTTAIGINAGNISTNTGNISTNTGNIATNTTDIGNNTTAIGVNTGNIATNTTAIGNNTTAIGVNTGNISTNTTNIGTNTTQIGINTSDIATLQGQVGALEENAGTWNYAVGYGAPASGEMLLPTTDFSTVTQVRISKTDDKGVSQIDLLNYLVDEQVTFNIRGQNNSHSYQATTVSDLGTYVQFNLIYKPTKSFGTIVPAVAPPYFIGALQTPIRQAFGYTFANNVNDTPILVPNTWVDISNPSVSGLPNVFSNTPYWAVTEPGVGQQTPTFTYSGASTRVWQTFITFDVENNNGGGADLSFRITINNVPAGVERRQSMESNSYQIVSGINFVSYSNGDELRLQLENNSNNDDPLITNLAINFVLIE